jgi:hypothetical protein
VRNQPEPSPAVSLQVNMNLSPSLVPCFRALGPLQSPRYPFSSQRLFSRRLASRPRPRFRLRPRFSFIDTRGLPWGRTSVFVLADALRCRISGSFPSVSVADGLVATAGSQELAL